MASRKETGAGGELSIRVPASGEDDPARGVLRGRRRKSATTKQERRLNAFVRFVAAGEWAGNAFGTLAFLWGTVVLLGGYCKDLESEFWYATAVIFIEALRMFSRNYRLEDRSLFRTTRAIKAISSPFVHMLKRPQEWNELAAIIGLIIYLATYLQPLHFEPQLNMAMAVLLILMSKLQFPGALQLMSRPRRYRRLLLWADLAVLLILAALIIRVRANPAAAQLQGHLGQVLLWTAQEKYVLVWAFQLAGIVAQVVAVLLLNFRPRIIANLTDRPCGRKLLSWAKVIIVMNCLGYLASPYFIPVHTAQEVYVVRHLLGSVGMPLATLILSLGSLQTPAKVPSSQLIDITLYICFFGQLVQSLIVNSDVALIALMVLLIGNLQIPAAVAPILISSGRLGHLAHQQHTNEDLVISIMFFYVLALCQGTLYVVACISHLFSFFLRRSLARQSGLRGKRGARAVDLYYNCVHLRCMETGILAAGKEVSLARFAIDSLSSRSRKEQLAGVLFLDSLLQQKEDLVSRIACSSEAVSALIGMLGWTGDHDGDIGLLAARVTAKLAGSLKVAATPGMLKMVSSLLDAKDQLATGLISPEDVGGSNTPRAAGSEPWRNFDSYVSRRWRRMKERWTVPEEPPLTHQDSFPALGMLILERLASDHDNCAEICRATNLISKITGLISYVSDNSAQQRAVVCSSLSLVRRLAITGGKVGISLRQELWEDPFLLDNLAGMLEDSRSSIKLWEPAMDIIAKLALAEEAREEIGSNKVIVGKLMHAFLGRYGRTNMHYSQPLRLAAGEALANLAIETPANCLALLEEPGYKLIKDLSDMLWHNEYRYVAATLLQNLCEHSRDKMCSLGANEHLSNALPVVMETIMAVEGKQMENLIGLVSQICNIIPECVVHSLESHLSVSAFVQKMVSALHANKKPRPEHPRMRRVIVELTISIIESHPHYSTIFIEGGMMEALSKIESSSSKVERYRIFLGNAGVVSESGLPLLTIVVRAKGLLDSATSGVHNCSPDIH